MLNQVIRRKIPIEVGIWVSHSRKYLALCAQLKDPARNGNRTLNDLLHASQLRNDRPPWDLRCQGKSALDKGPGGVRVSSYCVDAGWPLMQPQSLWSI
jgi:hypothetical protein